MRSLVDDCVGRHGSLGEFVCRKETEQSTESSLSGRFWSEPAIRSHPPSTPREHQCRNLLFHCLVVVWQDLIAAPKLSSWQLILLPDRSSEL